MYTRVAKFYSTRVYSRATSRAVHTDTAQISFKISKSSGAYRPDSSELLECTRVHSRVVNLHVGLSPRGAVSVYCSFVFIFCDVFVKAFKMHHK